MKKDTRELLVDSAFSSFYKNGYQGANIAEILKEVGINKGSMYHFFKSKKELGLAVVDERIRKNIKVKYEKVLDSKIPYSTLFEILRSSPDILVFGCPLNKMSQEMVYIDVDFKQLLSSVYKDFEKAIKNILVKAIYIGEIPECDPEVTARLIIASYEGGLMIYHLNQDRNQYEQVLNMLEKQFQ